MDNKENSTPSVKEQMTALLAEVKAQKAELR